MIQRKAWASIRRERRAPLGGRTWPLGVRGPSLNSVGVEHKYSEGKPAEEVAKRLFLPQSSDRAAMNEGEVTAVWIRQGCRGESR